MAECIECGATIAPGTSFCGNCGTHHPAASEEPKNVSGAVAAEAPPETAAVVSAEAGANAAGSIDEEPQSKPDPARTKISDQISPHSLGGSATGDVRVLGTTATKQKGTTGGHQLGVKQLDPNTVLNSRYEIVRRIGGGGMGAVYLAKDRNLGDAPRAVKEMVEAHLDPALHEKAIGDFKRESLLLTSLEHPSIPTIYDYFYDESLSRFYLVMKYISGGDLASRMRSSGGRLDEKTVADWG